MKNKKNLANTTASTSNLQELNDSAESQVIAEATEKVLAEPKIKETPVEERRYKLTTTEGEPAKFRGKQRQIVYNVLRAHSSDDPAYTDGAMTIAQIAEFADKLELKAVGGTEPSVRYHLHHMTKDGITEVVNPTIVLE